MSFSVLVIPEDPVLNGHILKPLAKAIMADAGRPAVKVDVLSNPRLRGYDHAVRVIRDELPERYSFKDLWLFFPDADKATGGAMRALEEYVAKQGIALLCCAAQPEVEIYASVAFRDYIPGSWEEARRHPRMKEEIFAPLLASHGDPRRGRGGQGPDDRPLTGQPAAIVPALPRAPASARPNRCPPPRTLNHARNPDTHSAGRGPHPLLPLRGTRPTLALRHGDGQALEGSIAQRGKLLVQE